MTEPKTTWLKNLVPIMSELDELYRTYLATDPSESSKLYELEGKMSSHLSACVNSVIINFNMKLVAPLDKQSTDDLVQDTMVELLRRIRQRVKVYAWYKFIRYAVMHQHPYYNRTKRRRLQTIILECDSSKLIQPTMLDPDNIFDECVVHSVIESRVGSFMNLCQELSLSKKELALLFVVLTQWASERSVEPSKYLENHVANLKMVNQQYIDNYIKSLEG